MGAQKERYLVCTVCPLAIGPEFEALGEIAHPFQRDYVRAVSANYRVMGNAAGQTEGPTAFPVVSDRPSTPSVGRCATSPTPASTWAVRSAGVRICMHYFSENPLAHRPRLVPRSPLCVKSRQLPRHARAPSVSIEIHALSLTQ